jgi:hypothetical protein
MNARAAHALRWAAYLGVLGLLSVAARPTRAQTAGAPPIYEDRLINGGTLRPDISAGDYLSTSDTTGLSRSVRVDAVTSVLSQTGPYAAPTAHENGFVGDVQWETSAYGAFSADAAVRIGAGAERFVVAGNDPTSFSLHQRDMPFDGGWQADNALGDLNTPLINLARQQPRFMLTSGTMLGAETEWRGPSNLQIVAGGGEPGVFEGIRVPTFQTLGGSTATLGAEWSPAPQWTVGGEYAGARDANIYYQPITSTLLPPEVSSQRISSNTALLSGAWQDGTAHGQLNFIDGTLDGNSNAFGVWADGAYTSGHCTQSFGAFHIDPNLAWGNQLIASDMQGGYYRMGYQSRRWTADFGVDEVLSVSGHGANSTFLNGNARYQLWRDTGIGGVANVLLASDGGHRTAWSIEGYLDNVNSHGTGRFQLDYADDSQIQDALLTVQQSWSVRAGTRLATSAGVEHIHSAALPGLPQADSTIVRVAAYGGGDLTSRLSLDGSVQWAQAVQGRAAPSTSADINLTYQITRSWGFILSFYENRIGSWTPLVVTSPLTPPVPVALPSQGQTGVFLTLRYQDARGGHFVPLGGAPGAGSGRLTGVVYLDTNENGHYDAGEAGAANVTVILDGRFSTRTDANGRFDFPAVAAGRHVLTVQQDNLPLPWTLANQGRTEVSVATRDRVDVNIGALRLK